MPQYNRAELGRMATESGFVRDTFEFDGTPCAVKAACT